jgi:hypothetical protein
MANQTVLSHRLITGIFRRHLALLVEELAVPWQADCEPVLSTAEADQTVSKTRRCSFAAVCGARNTSALSTRNLPATAVTPTQKPRQDAPDRASLLHFVTKVAYDLGNSIPTS